MALPYESERLMDKIYNFGAGPAAMPPEVKERAARELFGADGGISILEMSADSEEVKALRKKCESNLRKLLSIPAGYRVIFAEGAGVCQFSAIPMNLLNDSHRADYIVTGQFSSLAYHEAKRYGDVVMAASSAGSTPIFSAIPKLSVSDFRPDTDYVHICYNNTIYGTKFDAPPETGHIPLVADMTSCLLTEPVEVSKFGMIYADAGANIAPAALTVIIIREDLIGSARPETPASMNYKLLAEGKGVSGSSSIYGVYMTNLTLEWILSIGGLEETKRRGERKASRLYDFLDSGQEYYTATASKACRSATNVVFTTGSPALDAKFIKDAEAEGLFGLEGHASVGGIRASLYNAVPYEAVELLVKFMNRVLNENPKYKED